MKKTCFVSSYYELNRKNWTHFSRTFEDYLNSFIPYIKLFSDSDISGQFEMIVFLHDLDSTKILNDMIKGSHIRIIPINETFMKNLHIWSTIHGKSLQIGCNLR